MVAMRRAWFFLGSFLLTLCYCGALRIRSLPQARISSGFALRAVDFNVAEPSIYQRKSTQVVASLEDSRPLDTSIKGRVIHKVTAPLRAIKTLYQWPFNYIDNELPMLKFLWGADFRLRAYLIVSLFFMVWSKKINVTVPFIMQVSARYVLS